jgi:DNA-binding XRE family transcriptional regulator
MTKRREGSDSTLLTALSYTVRERREVLRLSQEEVAHRAKLHRTYISDIERGARNLSLKSLYDLARALELTTSELIITAEERLPSVRSAMEAGTVNVAGTGPMTACATTFAAPNAVACPSTATVVVPQLTESLN